MWSKKEVGFSTDTWTNVPYYFWSDSRIEGSRWYAPAYTQQCPACGKFFTLPRRNMQWLIDFHTPRTTRFSHLLFELHRLIGHKDVCEQMIESLTYDEYVRQRKIYCTENKLKFYDDEETLKWRYEKEMKDLRYALTQPLRPFIQDEIKPFDE